jgi:hypothetical protein
MTKIAEKLKREARREKVLGLRIEGKSLRAIAEELGVSERTARRDLKYCLRRLAQQTAEHCEELRALILARLDCALERLWPGILEGRIDAIDRLLKVESQRADLVGVKAPVKVAPTNPEGDEPYDGLSDDELLARVSALVEKAEARKAQGEN